MDKRCIIITGASGFIGEQLVIHFASEGWRVKAFVHSVPAKELNGVEYVRHSLEGKLNDSDFEGANFLVHGAYLRYERNRDSDAINLTGTKELVEMCRRKNIKFLFLSSFSGHTEAESHYGKTKLACEGLLDLGKDIVLKPGLVLGRKGLSGELIRTVKNTKFFPLVGGGQPVQTVHVDDLAKVIRKVLENQLSGLYHIAETDAITMKELYSEIARQLNKKLIFIPFPLPVLHLLCRLAESAFIALPVSSESVLGLKHLIKFDTKPDLDKLNIKLRNYSDSIRSILK